MTTYTESVIATDHTRADGTKMNCMIDIDAERNVNDRAHVYGESPFVSMLRRINTKNYGIVPKDE